MHETGNPNRADGIYTRPFRTAALILREIFGDKASELYQRLTWYVLRDNIDGLFKKVNATNIENIVSELFEENLFRGRGLFCGSCMESQLAAQGFTDVFTALVTVVNTKFPEIGKLLIVRIVLDLERAYNTNDKPKLMAGTKFIAHLVNQLVAREIIALELLTVLLENPTDDSLEVAVGFAKECGALLQDVNPQGLDGVFERFRSILHEGKIGEHVQFLIEGLFAIRKDKFEGFPAIRPDLDLVKHEDKITHEICLDDKLDPETNLDIFKANPNFEEDESGSEVDPFNLRTIYSTIRSNNDFQKASRELLQIKLEPGQEMELCKALLKCCSQQTKYLSYYALLGQQLCKKNEIYRDNFTKCFVQLYSTSHRLETKECENIAKFFAYLLGTDALQWDVFAYAFLTEEEASTSPSRIFFGILLVELEKHLGLKVLNKRLDIVKDMRFSINLIDSMGLTGMRKCLKTMSRLIMQQKPDSDGPGKPGLDGPCTMGSGVRNRNRNRKRERERESESEWEWEWEDRRREAGRGRVKGSVKEMERATARVKGIGRRERVKMRVAMYECN